MQTPSSLYPNQATIKIQCTIRGMLKSVRYILTCYYSYYRLIHLCRYICCYYPLNYGNSVIFIMFYFKLSLKFYFLTNIKSVDFCYYQSTFFVADKEIHNLQFLIINKNCRNQVTVTQTKQPMKDKALSGDGWSWWGRSWLRHKSPSFK